MREGLICQLNTVSRSASTSHGHTPHPSTTHRHLMHGAGSDNIWGVEHGKRPLMMSISDSSGILKAGLPWCQIHSAAHLTSQESSVRFARP